jgi:NAD(P)-dependent dehydrogenase (short-subunit alcohol dehydrogenase family)
VSHTIITGGAAGIGAAIAERLLARGERVSIVDRSAPDNADWWDPDAGPGGHRWVVADAGEPSEYEAAVASVVDDDVTGLVSCAGVSIKEDFLESTPEAWMQTLNVNVYGTAIACRSAARAMREAGGGSIVTVSSTAAFGYVNGLGAHYHASKGAIVGLTRALASELAPFGIRVNAVVPGLVRTPMTEMMRARHGEERLSRSIPLRHVAHAEELADAIDFFLSPSSAMITGHCLPVDGGQLAVSGHPELSFPALVTPRESTFEG